jgi:hypothetical protein
MTFISIDSVIIYVVFFGACMRCTRLCSLKPGVTLVSHCFLARTPLCCWSGLSESSSPENKLARGHRGACAADLGKVQGFRN